MLGDRITTGRFTIAILTSLSPALLAGAAGVVTTLAAAPAQADVQNVTPYYAVVTAANTFAHCGPNDRFYRIGEVPVGQVVMVDGEGEAWSRIAYPQSLPAYVRVEDVKVSGNAATLVTASKLKAANAASGYSGSWKALFDSPLPAGENLKVLEPVKEAESIVGYKIVAPDSARAYVESRGLRHATDAEVEAFKTKGSLPTLPAGKPASAPTPSGPAATPATPNQPAGAEATKPAGPVTINQGDTPKAAPAKPEDRAVGALDKLNETFDTVWKQPVLSSEVGELMAEFQRAADAAKDNPVLQRQLENRVNALKLRVEFRDTLRKQEEAKAALEHKKSQLDEEVAAWESSRVYTIVGELQPSTVYDGKRLPLMYRIITVGGTSPRTLGYLKPGKDVDLTKMMGQVVGVIGDATLDRSLMLNIIDPIKVVTLKEAAPPKPQTEANVPDKPEDVPAKSGN